MTRNVLVAGLVIGLLSGVWLLVLYLIGYETFFSDVLTIFTSGKPLKDITILVFTAILIPVIGLYFGLSSCKRYENGEKFTYLNVLLTGLKILIIGGMIAITLTILYMQLTRHGTISDFAKMSIGASLVGVAAALIISIILTTR